MFTVWHCERAIMLLCYKNCIWHMLSVYNYSLTLRDDTMWQPFLWSWASLLCQRLYIMLLRTRKAPCCVTEFLHTCQVGKHLFGPLSLEIGRNSSTLVTVVHFLLTRLETHWQKLTSCVVIFTKFGTFVELKILRLSFQMEFLNSSVRGHWRGQKFENPSTLTPISRNRKYLEGRKKVVGRPKCALTKIFDPNVTWAKPAHIARCAWTTRWAKSYGKTDRTC